MWGSKPLMIVSTTDILVLHTAKVVHFHYNSRKSSKRTLNPTMHVLIRHSTPLSRCFCIGTLRGISKESLYVCTGPWFFTVPQKTKLPPSPPSIHKPIIHQTSAPNHNIQFIQLLSQDQSHMILWLYGFSGWFSIFQLIYNTHINKHR